MDMGIDAAGGDDPALAGDDLRAGADDDVDARLDIGIAGLADGRDAAVLDGDIRLHDSPMVEDQGIGDDGVDRAGGTAPLALAHAVADHFAAAELHLLAIDREIALHLDEELGIGQADAVAGGGPEHIGIGAPGDAGGHLAALSRGPAISPRKPWAIRAPAKATRRISRLCPGSKRTAVPAGMARR